ncbi:acyl-CoA carboxylase subunit beta [Shewanella sp. D64]|uniref:acyl-CoA carboxylase subunit beta n=1 Tax=unclassified Shewanella TaxID=196818 RepID=UPI0022BA3BF0|nr:MULTISPECIES: acyl-CoA carboxylase subunit beta [unclassified Shewanella]MEC4724710.1 acyl-CoA carboxylase subunit beta [Shewanella sp. D64]MEC4736496.1 acyl-CoA carboxylase subunit beta [Shewanella sp. E94]WBJ97450.1 acyl-CoA carboxylase subunit beta [Shewanella sp. MTB7]
MAILSSDIEVQNQDFNDNRSAMLTVISEFREIEQRVMDKSSLAKGKFQKQGKLLPRERLNLLLDAGSGFIELCALAGYMMHDDKDGTGAGGGLIAGIGFVAGIRCLIQVNNSAIKGGTISPTGLDKTLRLQEIAKENKLPLITLAESGGANLNYATDIFVPGARAFANQARLSAQGVPQITLVHGNATAGGAYQPGLSDYLIVIKNKTKMFLAGPPLLKAATGEIATDEALGGADLHAYEAGTADYLAQDDVDGIRIVREILHSLPWNEQLILPEKRAGIAPLYPAEELLGIVPAIAKKAYDVREVIARLVDGSDFQDFKPEFDTQTLCGFAYIDGHSIGIIGNNGPITAKGANKAAQFIQLCEQGQRSLLFLHNTTGFMVGTDAERNGIIKHGSKLIQAVANASVPKFSILIGGSYGAGNYAMCGRGLDPRFIFAWPNGKTAVMGGEQAGKVLRIVTEQKMRKLGQAIDEAQLDQLEQGTAMKLNANSTAIFGTARLWDDGLIDPRDTRVLLANLLDICWQEKHRQLASNRFGVARF